MIPKWETPEAAEERGTGSTKHARLSNRSDGKRKIIEVLGFVLVALMLPIYAFYRAKLAVGTWFGFWALTIFMGVWLILGVSRVLRKTNHETDKRNPSVQDRR